MALLPEDEQFVPRLAGEDGTPSAVAQGIRVKQAFDHLRREFTHDQAAGLVGNFMQESGEGLDPTAFNEREGAIGIAQWRLGEERNLKAFAAQRGTTETDFHVQLEFVMHELNGREARAKAQIKACTTLSKLLLLCANITNGHSQIMIVIE